MTKKEYEKISKLIDDFIETSWVTPYYAKQSIPSDKIPQLKARIRELVNEKHN